MLRVFSHGFIIMMFKLLNSVSKVNRQMLTKFFRVYESFSANLNPPIRTLRFAEKQWSHTGFKRAEIFSTLQRILATGYDVILKGFSF